MDPKLKVNGLRLIEKFFYLYKMAFETINFIFNVQQFFSRFIWTLGKISQE